MLTGLEGKLFEALAKLGTSQGFELKGGGPGKPSQELVNQFLEAFNNAQPSEKEMSMLQTDENLKINLDDNLNVSNDTPKSNAIENDPNLQNFRLEQVDASADIDAKSNSRLNEVNNDKNANSDNLMDELANLVKEISGAGNSLSPNQLFRAQYIMGVLKTQSTTGMKISQSGSQGLESLLKQNG